MAWPDDGLAEVALDRDTGPVVLTHDEKFDVPALAAAIRSEAFSIAALGSRTAPASTSEPRAPSETAVSILTEALALRAGRGGGPLRSSSERIHVER